MRLAADINSPYYHPMIHDSIKIFLDGKEFKYATEVDDKAGWIKALARGEDGHCLKDENGEFIIETIYGDVDFALTATWRECEPDEEIENESQS